MHSQIYFHYWLKSFIFTLIIEAPFYVLLGRKAVPWWRALLAGAACSCVTHPALWFLWPRVIHVYKLYILSGEILVCIIETFIFYALARPIKLSRAVAASFIANAASYGLGVLSYKIGIL